MTDATDARVGDAPNSAKQASRTIRLKSTITCPACGHRAVETMPTDACQYFYRCKGCGARLKPMANDCCVFCSYGDVPCPPVQLAYREAS
jgi:transcription elongation factor Elf1